MNYPNETDFWEILNKNLVNELLTKPIPTEFGINYNLANVVDSLTVGINIQPNSSGVPYPRSTTVTGIPSSKNAIVPLSASVLIPNSVSASVPEPRVLFGLDVLTLIGLRRRKLLLN
ncbi:hypothetical protein [Iningainema tapete]|uniref:Uncharacterized protein n=1 Tax=Iningainema tapete BLCC-T55 TaxID=2748662 RepID=A0A8J7BYX9_9CYAN|nr:hypothetical protein [Iningainema tapete]MBD2774798.1 hypothetical protein [Iningainema tapete BLCC-T55]